MVVDTSILVAILLKEEGWEIFLQSLDKHPEIYVSAVTYHEFFVVVQRRLTYENVLAAERLIADFKIEIIAFDEAQALLARIAYKTYGKGRHPAGLNFGDCFSYALAKYLKRPLLYKGNDFAQTDVQAALLT